MDVGPKRDLLGISLYLCFYLTHFLIIGDLAKSVRNKTDLHFGVYHSLLEWFNPLMEEDIKNGHKTHNFVDVSHSEPERFIE
jgi:alpha-L-fucosidase